MYMYFVGSGVSTPAPFNMSQLAELCNQSMKTSMTVTTMSYSQTTPVPDNPREVWQIRMREVLQN